MDNEELLVQALHSGLVEENSGQWDLLVPSLVENNGFSQSTVLASILNNLELSHSFYWAAAFITKDGLAMLKLALADCASRGVTGRLLTANYLGFNKPEVYEELLKIPNLEVRILPGPFHVKGYGFDLGEHHSFILGSANLTANALKRNFEWNISLRGKPQGKFFKEIKAAYENLYAQGKVLDENWLTKYRLIYQQYKDQFPGNKGWEQENFQLVSTDLMPNGMQQRALANLAKLREGGANKGLLISATGTGKTYLAAFHCRAMKPKRCLFLAHREELLQQAAKTFAKVMGPGFNYGLLSGNHKDYQKDYVFATIQTMSKDEVLAQFAKDEFQAIIMDEIHHGGSKTYQKVWQHFAPQFLLGMTATPERRDNFNIYELFDHHIVYEIRLQEALGEDLLCPFHYYGLQDFTVNEEIITEQTEFKKLTHGERIKHLLDNIHYYGHDGGKLKGLAFCSTVAEAQALAAAFNEQGLVSQALAGKDKIAFRSQILDNLQDENHPLNYIFTVDIFNEGVDIPQLNQIMMLRPTTSPTIFIQQLGRGLRKYQGKNYVTILDFIGNYENACNIPVALSGDTSFNKDNLRRYLQQGSKIIPGLSTVNFTAVAKEQIFKSLDKVKWDKAQLLVKAYQTLQNKLGRSPLMMDFIHYGEMSPAIFLAHKNAYNLCKGATSFYGFVARYIKEFADQLTYDKEIILGYVSQKFAPGKRAINGELLANLAKHKKVYVKAPRNLVENLIKLFSNDFNTTYKVTEVFKGAELARGKIITAKPKGVMLDYQELMGDNVVGEFIITDNFARSLENKIFAEYFWDLMIYINYQQKEKYENLYQNSPFVYGGKYTYEDVCMLLNWEVNIPSLNIGGYKWDKATDTMPIFINYHTGDNYQRKIDYQHGFKNPGEFTCYSKPRRNLNSPEIQRLLDKNNPATVYLFVRKHKDDSQTAKEFYFLGTMITKSMVETTLPNGTPGVEMNFLLDEPVEASLYDYIVNL